MRLLVRSVKLGLSLSVVTLAIAWAAPVAQATDNSVQVQVTNNTPILQLTSIDGVTPSTTTTTYRTSSRFLRLFGAVNKLVQIRVYVDSTFSATIPLATNSVDFTYDLQLDPGIHTVTLEGITSDTTSNLLEALTVDYTPSPTPQVPLSGEGSTPTPTTPAGAPIDPSAIVTPQASAVALPSWLYSPLAALDLVQPNSPAGSANGNYARAILVVTSLVMIGAAQFVLRSYYVIRYGLLHLHTRPAPRLLRHHPTVSIRIIGILLLLAVFLWP
ncbi:MAG TPA: hypothetical protein VN081_01030 [Dongiaceae bacterium]|nr:hypothetical protein [Dongiaceae bacterium]